MRWLLALFMIGGCLAAETVQIGSGTLVNQSLPIEPARAYSYSQQVYLASEIQSAGRIHSLSFQYSVSGSIFLSGNNLWRVWVGHTQRGQLGDWVPLDSLSLVWEGILQESDFSGSLPGQGWLTLTLQNLFIYNGMDNLLIAVDENSPEYSSTSDEFLCTQTGSPRGIVFNSLAINPDPADPPSPSASGFYVRQAHANLRLELQAFSYIPYLPQPEDQAQGVPTSASLSWQSQAESWDLFFGEDAGQLEPLAQNLSLPAWSFAQPLQPLVTYYWSVTAHQGAEEFPGPVWSFRTLGEPIGPPYGLNAYWQNDHVRLGWSPPELGTALRYRIYRNDVWVAQSQSLSYLDYEVAAGQTYIYYLRSENHLGELSGPSNVVSVHVPEEIENLILNQDFETCPPFSQEIEAWSNLDLDLSNTWPWDGVSFPHEGEALAWLSFFPAQTTPPLSNLPPHAGSAMLACISSLTPPNNDWLISPPFNLGEQPQLSFWARSHTDAYGLERLRVLISTSGADPQDFVPISSPPHIAVPAAWTEYTYDLSAWSKQSVRLAWHCLSWDAFALYLDDILITGEGGYLPLDEDLQAAPDYRIYPNPSRGAFRVENPAKTSFSLEIFDLRGRRVFSARDISSFDSRKAGPGLSSGVYLLRLSDATGSRIRRLAISK
jgi:hypothetical protein